MERALELAVNGAGNVSPNPMVGCVVVWDDKIIAEGWHMKYGSRHAEVNAINAVKDKSMLAESTVYVTLEPCNFHGNTPPCADLLVSSKVKRVVICNLDPNPKVSGGGVQKLMDNNIEVEIGVLEERGKEINKRFFTYHNKKRPYIILKWAETADGFIAKEDHDSKWISNTYSRQLVHQWRAEEDAILIGKNTAEFDNPMLNVRDTEGKDPIRIVIDPKLKLSKKLHLFDQQQTTLVFNLERNEAQPNLEYIKLHPEQIEHQILDKLYLRKILSLIIEGGSTTLQKFIGMGLWDEARLFKSNKKFSKGIASPQLDRSVLKTVENILDDRLFIYTRNDG